MGPTDRAKGAQLSPQPCGACGSNALSVFYEIEDVPVHSVLLMATREEALTYRKGDIKLGFCHVCGFISNLAFDPSVHEYSARCEETQGFSPTFNEFHRRLAARLVERYDVHDKNILEIGCGKGEFLSLLCELGGNRGVGFDPAYVEGRNQGTVSDKVRFVKDLYSEKYSSCHADLVCCKMTLEHIQGTSEFVAMVRRSIGDRLDTIVFFQVPEVRRILRELAFWDIYYEHCSYFSAGSLERLFRNCGFAVIDVWRDYDGQYVMIEAKAGEGRGTPERAGEEDLEDLARDMTYFSKNCRRKVDDWKSYLKWMREAGKRVVIWGSGSKGVSFLTTLNIRDEIEYIVDINPYKQGTYMAGTGQRIVGPDFLREYKPDVVIAMNPVYRWEIKQDLERMNLSAELVTV